MFGYSIDTSLLKEYQIKVLKAQHKLIDFEKKFLNTLANMVMQRAIPNTPVDTGTLRRSYKVTKVTQKGGTLEITIYNDAKQNDMDESYASYVEYGHFTRGRVSWVDGHWMLTIATDEVKAEMIRVWNQLYDEFIKEAGI
jgi:hypothetical protein